MTDPFYGSKFSIEWAKDHIAEFEREVEIFNSPDNYTTISEVDADGAYNLLKFRLTKPMRRPLHGHVIDTVHNLRAALDQVLFSVAALTETPVDTVYFPIRNSKAEFETALNKLRAKLPKEISDLVCKFKPYKGENDLIWALNKLCNTNKHGIIRPLPLATSLMGAEGTSQAGKLGSIQIPYPPQWDGSKNEMVIARAPLDCKFTMNYDFAFFIAFSDIAFIGGKPVITTLYKFFDEVNGFIVAVETECRRIGLL